MSTRQTFSEEELSAYIDGELDEATRVAVESCLASNAALAEHAALLAQDKKLLKAVYGPIESRPLPENWRVRIEAHTQRRWSRGSIGAMAAIAAAFVVAMGTFTLWQPDSGTKNRDVIAEALDVRNGVVRPETTIAHVAPAAASQALKDSLRMRLKAPDLSRMGYTLAALQIYAGAAGERPVELIYRGAGGRSFTLYLRRPVGRPRFDQFERGNVRVCIWQDDVLGTVMAGKMSAPEMQRLASLSYTGLTL